MELGGHFSELGGTSGSVLGGWGSLGGDFSELLESWRLGGVSSEVGGVLVENFHSFLNLGDLGECLRRLGESWWRLFRASRVLET